MTYNFSNFNEAMKWLNDNNSVEIVCDLIVYSDGSVDVEVIFKGVTTATC